VKIWAYLLKEDVYDLNEKWSAESNCTF